MTPMNPLMRPAKLDSLPSDSEVQLVESRLYQELNDPQLVIESDYLESAIAIN